MMGEGNLASGGRPRRLSLAAEIAEGLRESILSGDRRPGNRIGELEVAESFGTSQAPVREAFALLRSEGLLVALPRRGTFVSTVSLTDARAAYEVRLQLDPFVATQVLHRVGPADLDALSMLVDNMAAAAARRDLEDMTRHDMAFHGYLYEMCDSAIISRIWELLSLTVRQFIVVAGRQYFEEEEFSTIAQMHADLLSLIKVGDAHEFQIELKRQLDVMWQRIDESSDSDEAENRPG